MEEEDTSAVEPISMLGEQPGAQYTYLSLGIFPLTWRTRRWAIRLAENPMAEMVILMAIVANSILLALYDPLHLNAPLNEVVFNTEIVFLVIYSVEMLVKIYAFGFLWESNKNTYLRNGWNVLDIIVVFIGWLAVGVTSLGSAASFASTLRLFRLLRPWRGSKSTPALSWVTRALLRAVPQLLSGGVLFLILSIISSVFGMTFFRGSLRQRCVYIDDPTRVVEQDLEENRFCALDSQLFGRRCPYVNSTCGVVDFNPNNNITSFDDAVSAFIILFEMITMEGWSEIMYWIADANGTGTQLYFIANVILGGIIILNVLLAVLAVNITVQRQIDQSEKERDEDIKSIEQSLLERRLLSEKFGAEDLALQKTFVRFLKRAKVHLKDSMEMRLILSYERMHEVPGYKLVSEAEYERLLEKHAAIYSEWKRHITKVLDPTERVAAAKRDQQDRDARRAWERRAAVMTEKEKKIQSTFSTSNLARRYKYAHVTPPFIIRDFQAMQEEARLKLREAEEAKRSKFRKFDDFVGSYFGRVSSKYAELKEDSYAGQKDNASFIQKKCYWLVSQWWFDKYLMNTIIALNVLILSTVHYDQPDWLFDLLIISDIVFAAIFVLEMVLKIVGFGFLKYMSEPWNVFDGFVAVISLLQFANTNSVYITAFRAVRLFRLFRFIMRLNALRRILEAVSKTMRVVIPFLFIVFLFLFISTIMGLQLFGGILQLDPSEADCSPSYPAFPHCPPRNNFDSFFLAFVTTFQVLTKENWNDIMYNVVSASSFWSFLWFFGVIVVGTLVVLNIFLGVLIDSFLRASEERKQVEFGQSMRDMRGIFKNLSARDPAKTSGEKSEDGEDVRASTEGEQREGTTSNSKRKQSIFQNRANHSRAFTPEENPLEAQFALKEHLEQRRNHQKKKENWRFENHASYPYKSLFGKVSGDHPVRHSLGNLVRSPAFQYFMLAVIIISSISLCFESASVSAQLRHDLEVINDFVASAILLEMILKMFCFGVYGHPGAYFRDNWNKFDFILAIPIIVSLILQQNGYVPLVHVFRAFYPLRSFRYVDGLRVAFKSVGRAVVPVCEVALFMCLFFLAGGILGTLLFQGSFSACYEGPTTAYPRIAQDNLCFPANARYSPDPCPPANQCNASQWLNPTIAPGAQTTIDFDSVPKSLLVLFEMSALENWFVPMYAAMDSTSIGRNFRREYTQPAAFFFVLFVLFFNVLLVQLFVAVVVDSFQQSEREAEATAYLTARQQEWIRMQKKAIRLPFRSKELAPSNEPFKTIHSIVVSSIFKKFMMSVTLFNTGVLLSMHAYPSESYLVFFEVVDYFVGTIYIIEAILKLFAFGFVQYFRRIRNWLEIIICIMTIVGWAVPSARNLVQFVDVFKIVGIVYYMRQTRHLVSTLVLSTPALVNVASLVFFIYYIYGVIGLVVFSDIRNYPPTTGGKFAVLNDHVNFDDFGSSLLTLFRMSTGEGWNAIMRDLASSSNTHAANFAYFYCLSFIVIVQFCLLNLIVAVIMFDISDEIENNALGKSSNVSINHLVTYAKVWADIRYDYDKRMRDLKRRRTEVNTHALPALLAIESERSKQTTTNSSSFAKRLCSCCLFVQSRTDFDHPQMRMPFSELMNLIVRLPPPLGLNGVRNLTKADALRVIKALQIPVNENGEIHYHATLSALIDRVVLGDVINKTLKHSLLGGPGDNGGGGSVPIPGGKIVPLNNPKSTIEENETNRFEPDDLLGRVTDELRELLHLQIPQASVAYKQDVEKQNEREDGHTAATLIATKLLHKAAARYLKRKKDMARKSGRIVGTSPGHPISLRAAAAVSSSSSKYDDLAAAAQSDSEAEEEQQSVVVENASKSAFNKQVFTELDLGESFKNNEQQGDSQQLNQSSTSSSRRSHRGKGLSYLANLVRSDHKKQEQQLAVRVDPEDV